MSTPDPKPVPSRVPASASPLTELDARSLGRTRNWFATHPIGTDRVVVALYLVASAIAVTATEYPGTRWWVAASSLIIALLLLRRRAAPVPVAIAVGSIGALSILTLRETGAFDLAAAVAVYTVAANRPPRVAWSVLAGAAVVVGGAALIASPTGVLTGDTWSPTDTPIGQITADRIIIAGVVIVELLIAMSIGATVRSRRLHIADLVDRANSFAREAEQGAQIAAAAERARIAREMHDVVAHSLTVMVALADGAKALGRKEPELAGQALDELTATGRNALTDMRSILGVLRDPAGPETADHHSPPTGAADLDDVVATFRTAGLPVRLVQSGVPLDLTPAVRRAVDRIVTEALTNVLRHAPLTPDARVAFHGVPSTDGDGGAIDVIISNTHGAGKSEPAAGSGQGIIGMRERAAALGGTVEVGPHGSGWQVHAVLPVKEEK